MAAASPDGVVEGSAIRDLKSEFRNRGYALADARASAFGRVLFFFGHCAFAETSETSRTDGTLGTGGTDGTTGTRVTPGTGFGLGPLVFVH